MKDWAHHAHTLADNLVEQGKLTTPAWIEAVRDTPRHVFVPGFYEQDQASGTWRWIDSGDAGLDRIYSNTGLYTKIGPDPLWGHTVGLSSTTTPGLMTRMLETLDIRDGHRVLEIGTGTGYNAALLSHRLGDPNVISIDVERDLVTLARERLGELGYFPSLAVADGLAGWPHSAPYDRVLATCAVPGVPWSWIEQLSDGGRALADIKRTVSAGNLVLLQRDGDRAEGRFLPGWATFMPLRSGPAQHVHPPGRDRTRATTRTSTIGYIRPWENTVAWFLAALTMPRDVAFGCHFDPDTGEPGDLFLYSADGSWAEISNQPNDHGTHPVWEAGPNQLWQHIEHAYTTYDAVGKPEWPRLGLTTTPHEQWVWLDHPHGSHTWEITP